MSRDQRDIVSNAIAAGTRGRKSYGPNLGLRAGGRGFVVLAWTGTTPG